MADSKKYDGSQWEHSLRKLTTATADIEPTIYTDGTAITNYTIKGNTTQSGTPTPSAPISVTGVGNKTANLWSEEYTGISENLTYVPIYVGDGQFTLSTSMPTHTEGSSGYFTNLFLLSGNVSTGASTAYNGVWNNHSITQNAIDGYVTIAYRIVVDNPSDYETMLNTGSTAKPYEPYGYKMPNLTSQGSAVNYLGSVQSYREIAKYIFDGTDNFTWTKSGTRNFSWFFNPLFLPDRGKEGTPFLCSHGATVTTLSEFVYGTVYADNTYNLGIFPSELTTVTELRQWLATQYANGTPVTIWYSLYTPTTATVNEPLMKIGTYADSISNATAIPTTDGANSITVDTTVQPSEFTATWTGWHDSSVKEWDGSNWQ